MKIVVVHAGSHAQSWEHAVEIQVASQSFRFDFRGTIAEAEQYITRFQAAVATDVELYMAEVGETPVAITKSDNVDQAIAADHLVSSVLEAGQVSSQENLTDDHARMSDDGGAHSEEN